MYVIVCGFALESAIIWNLKSAFFTLSISFDTKRHQVYQTQQAQQAQNPAQNQLIQNPQNPQRPQTQHLQYPQTPLKWIFVAFDVLIFVMGLCAIILSVHLAFGLSNDIIINFDNTTINPQIFENPQMFENLDSAFNAILAIDFNAISSGKLYAYSVVFVLCGAILLGIYLLEPMLKPKHTQSVNTKSIDVCRFYSLALFIIAALKVFFIDTSSFGSLSKIGLFIFIGIVFLGISYVYSRFVFKKS